MTSNDGDVFIGGLAGGNTGDISNSFATGNVTATNAAMRSPADLRVCIIGGNVFQCYATGNVAVSGDVGIAGGFVGINIGYLNQVFSTGAGDGHATATSSAALSA